VLFFGFHSIFAILEPSGKSLPLLGVDHRGIGDHHFQQIFSLTDRDDLPILATPLKSENASPFGARNMYLSCAEETLPPRTASAIPRAAAETTRKPREDKNVLSK
jgi:hypothetical protein